MSILFGTCSSVLLPSANRFCISLHNLIVSFSPSSSEQAHFGLLPWQTKITKNRHVMHHHHICCAHTTCAMRSQFSRLGMTLQARQHEQREFEQRAARIQKLEARQKQEEAAAVKALGQQLLVHQVSLLFHHLCNTQLPPCSKRCCSQGQQEVLSYSCFQCGAGHVPSGSNEAPSVSPSARCAVPTGRV